MTTFLKKIDLMGSEFNITHEGYFNYKTIYGGVLTIMAIGFSIYSLL
jgi:hypothetical protein